MFKFNNRRYILLVLIIIIAALLSGCSESPTSLDKDSYTISGEIVNENGEGISNVKIKCSDGETTSTNSSGEWRSDGLKGEVKITPAKEGYIFEPLSITVDKKNDGIRFTGSEKIKPEIELMTNSDSLTANLNGSVSDSDGYIKTVDIDWGDGETQSLSSNFDNISENHSYSSDGSYKIKVTAEDNDGIKASKNYNISLISNNKSPKIELTSSSNSLSVNIKGSVSDSDGSIKTVDIDWGDGNTTSISSGFESIDSNYVYNNEGSYSIEITAEDNDQGISSKLFDISLDNTDQPPSQPQLSSPSDGKTIFDTSVTLSWEASSDPEGNSITYDVFLDKLEEPIKKVADGISATNYDIYGLEKGYTYYWKVVAYDSNGNKSESLIWNFTPEKVITFEDANLEEVIRNKINKSSGDIYKSDVINIVELVADDNNISSIEGIQHLENIEKLDLGVSFTSNTISDISPLAKLTHLISLSLAENQVSDITPLSNLTNLQALALHNNPIGDISPISNLTNLNYLYLENTQISEINSLSDMMDMQKLDIRNNTISDISPLSNFTNLDYLLMQGNEITDISSLVENSGIDKGDRVDVSDNYLDLTEGSEDMDDINTLLNRDVDLIYEPQN